MSKIKTFIENHETKLALGAAGAVILAFAIFVTKNNGGRYPFSLKRYSLEDVEKVFTQFCNANDLNESEAMQKLEIYLKKNS